MYKIRPFFRRSIKRRHGLARIALVAGFICLAIIGWAGGPLAAHADGIPGGNVNDPVVRAVDIAKPAVVRIITFIDGKLTVRFSNGQDVTFPQNDPRGYPLVLSGSGTFITAHGDILTADHVVNPPHQALDQFLDQVAAPDVANYMNQVLRVNPQVTADQITQALQNGNIQSNSQYDTPRSRVYLSTDYTGPLSATTIQNVPSNVFAPVDRIEKESVFNEKDVAIIHVLMNDMAMVQLGDSSTVQQQDELTIIGFPGNGDIAGNSPTDLLTLSVNKVFVSSIKTNDAGAPVIQVGGNVEPGDSGGPALDGHGAIVGIVSFGPNTPGNTSFLQTSNGARTLVQELGLNTTPGPFQSAWNQAFMDYAANTPGHWHKATQEFQQIANRYPLFKAVTPYLNYAEQQAKSEKLPQSTPTSQSPQPAAGIPSFGYWILVGAVVIILLAVLLFGAVALRRRRTKPAPATAITPPPYTMPPSANRTPAPPVTYNSPLNDGMTAFGAPPSSPSWPRQPPAQPTLPSPGSPTVPSGATNVLVPWPCGHMNRPMARFCSVCGEPAPARPPAHRFEQ